MLPDGLTIELIDDIIYWKNTTGSISEQDALNIAEQIKEMIETKSVRAVIVDNRKLYGVWSPEVDKVWVDLMSYLPNYVDKTATLCQNHINKLQLDYLSSQAGTKESVKAFTERERHEMEYFLKLETNILDHH
tara:strand:- start:385 stop:783 length:399 start_codon:yes stop_codon:yes gene_type:complete